MAEWWTGQKRVIAGSRLIVFRSSWNWSSARTTRRRGKSWDGGLSLSMTWCRRPVSPACRAWCASRHAARRRAAWVGRFWLVPQGRTAAMICWRTAPVRSRSSARCWTSTSGLGRPTTSCASGPCSRSKRSTTGPTPWRASGTTYHRARVVDSLPRVRVIELDRRCVRRCRPVRRNPRRPFGDQPGPLLEVGDSVVVGLLGDRLVRPTFRHNARPGHQYLQWPILAVHVA